MAHDLAVEFVHEFINRGIQVQVLAASVQGVAFDVNAAFHALAALFLVWRVKVQGFSFSAGLRGGMEPLAVFTSLPYTVCVLFLMGLTVYLYRVG